MCSKLWCKNYTKIKVKQTCSLRVSLLLWGRKKVSWFKLGNSFLRGHKTPICDLQFWSSQNPEKANGKDSIHFSDDDLRKKIEIQFIIEKCWIFVDDYQIILLPEATSYQLIKQFWYYKQPHSNQLFLILRTDKEKRFVSTPFSVFCF